MQLGRLRQLAVTSAQRFPPLPGVPAAVEAGYPQFDVTSWWGLLAPARVWNSVPRPTIQLALTRRTTGLIGNSVCALAKMELSLGSGLLQPKK